MTLKEKPLLLTPEALPSEVALHAETASIVMEEISGKRPMAEAGKALDALIDDVFSDTAEQLVPHIIKRQQMLEERLSQDSN